MALAFQDKEIPIQDAIGKMTLDESVHFQRKVLKDGTAARADVAIRGFRLDQKDNQHLQPMDIVQMQVGNVAVTNEVVSFRVICEYRGKGRSSLHRSYQRPDHRRHRGRTSQLNPEPSLARLRRPGCKDRDRHGSRRPRLSRGRRSPVGSL